MSRCWLAMVDHRPSDAFAVAEIRDGTTAAGYLAAWLADEPPADGAAKVDPRAIDPNGTPSAISLVLGPRGRGLPFDDMAVSQAIRGVLALPPADSFTTLLRGDAHFVGAVTACRGDRYRRLDVDPFAAVFPARRLQLGAGLIGATTAPVGPNIQRYGSSNPWPWDRF